MEDMKIGAIAHKAIFYSSDLIHRIELQIMEAQNLKLSLIKFPKNIFEYRKKIKNLEKSYMDLFNEFQNKFVFDSNKIDDYKKGVVFKVDKDECSFSLFFTALPSAMYYNIESDPKIVNKEIVQLGLLSHSQSYNNILERIDSLFSTLRQELNLKEQMYNNMSFLWINFIIIILALIGIMIALFGSKSEPQTINYFFNFTQI